MNIQFGNFKILEIKYDNDSWYIGISGCGGTYTAATGTISSPGHSSTYEPNVEYEWKIQLPSSERIKAVWLQFNLEQSTRCQFDYVEVIFQVLFFRRRKSAKRNA